MKSISQIFRSNRELMDEPEVQELIEYCRELEGQVMDRKIDDNYDKEHVLRSMLKDIRTGIDFKDAMLNLKKFLAEMCFINKIIL